MPESKSLFEEIREKGDEVIDPDDWAAPAQRRVALGSDGLWLRFGAKQSDSMLSQMFTFRFNPCVSACSVILLFSLVGFCSIRPASFCSTLDESWVISNTSNNGSFTVTGETVQTIKDAECFMPMKEFGDWMLWVTTNFTWLYILTQDVWIIFLIWLYFSRFGNIKLGRDTDEPEFSTFAWFAMLFTCGVATGLFFFAVTEPQYYYNIAANNDGYYERNRWSMVGVFYDGTDEHPIYNTPNARVQEAMNATWYHWGLHGWVVYCLMGLVIGLLHWRKGLPLTIKSCFYPLLGERIYGFAGDFVDTMSVVATTMGVCTSLGLGVMQLNTGIEMLNGEQHWLGLGYYNKYNFDDWKDRVDDLKSYWDSYSESQRAAEPWYGVNGTVNIATAGKVASIEAQNNQQMLLIWIITGGATTSVMLGLKRGIMTLALVCFGCGCFLMFYVWMMDDTWFLTNLFVQSIGHYIWTLPQIGFYTSAVEQSEVNNPYGEYSSWQYWWTIFYWGWWIAWAPFVGVFLARIGKGRTVSQFIFGTIFAPVVYNLFFMDILGGAGLKMQLLAEKYNVGTDCAGSASLFVEKGGDSYNQAPFTKNICRETSSGKYSGEKELHCSTITNLACSLAQNGSRPLFDLFIQYADVGKFLVVFTMISLTLYFVASSDSGSMVDDMVTANGMPEACLSQRFFWAMTEGAAASALLSVGKYVGSVDGGLKALRAASICVGLPYTFFACLMCVSLLRMLQYETKERKWGEGFKSSAVDFGITFYQCGEGQDKVFNLLPGKIELPRIKGVLTCLFCPAKPLWNISAKLQEKRGLSSGKLMAVGCSVLFYTWFILLLCDYAPVDSSPVAWGSVMGNVSSPDGNFRYYTSTRYGYFREYANKDTSNGAEVTYSTNYNTQAGEIPFQVTVNGTTLNIGMGDRMGMGWRVAAFGWFFWLIFVTYISFIRSEVRELCQIPGSLVEDFIVSLLWPTALYQIEEQAAQADTKDGQNQEAL